MLVDHSKEDLIKDLTNQWEVDLINHQCMSDNQEDQFMLDDDIEFYFKIFIEVLYLIDLNLNLNNIQI